MANRCLFPGKQGLEEFLELADFIPGIVGESLAGFGMGGGIFHLFYAIFYGLGQNIYAFLPCVTLSSYTFAPRKSLVGFSTIIMETIQKELYTAPEVYAIEVKVAGIICNSKEQYYPTPF